MSAGWPAAVEALRSVNIAVRGVANFHHGRTCHLLIIRRLCRPVFSQQRPETAGRWRIGKRRISVNPVSGGLIAGSRVGSSASGMARVA